MGVRTVLTLSLALGRQAGVKRVGTSLGSSWRQVLAMNADVAREMMARYPDLTVRYGPGQARRTSYDPLTH
jgi:hypothetical protein